MFINSIKMQIKEMFGTLAARITFWTLFAVVLVNFLTNMINNYEVQYVSQMYDPIKVLTLSDWSISGYFLMMVYPILVVIPTACTYFVDKETRVKLYIESRIGKHNYWYGKAISVFLVTFLIFTLPFLLEILLECICFNMGSAGDPSNFEYVQTIEDETGYLLSTLYVNNKILFAIIMTLLFGIVSGILAVFNFTISTFRFIKYKIFTFVPIYMLLYFLAIAEYVVGSEYTFNYYGILRIFNAVPKNYVCYGVFLLCLLAVSGVLIKIKTIKDDLL